ncbi:SMI1/KNR4 family protein [Acidovorax sp. YS12]|nr:SMI1/KNR4 family protein [Acidovorax sp. YS12]
MKNISSLIDELQVNWGKAHSAIHRGEAVPFQLCCEFFPVRSEFLLGFSENLPPDLAEFWRHASAANLFKDAEYGQWGLEIFDAQKAKAESLRVFSNRPEDFLESDLVIGRFLGDSDLLVIRNDRGAEDFGSILVALPIDKRNEWNFVAASFLIFLERFVEAEGDKFWEN